MKKALLLLASAAVVILATVVVLKTHHGSHEPVEVAFGYCSRLEAKMRKCVCVALSALLLDAAHGAGAGQHTTEGDGPMYFAEQLAKGMVESLKGQRADIAVARWRIAKAGAEAAKRPMPILNTMVGTNTALVVVDMQRCFLDEGAAIEVPAGRQIIPNINRLAASVRAKGGVVVFFRYLVNENAGLLKHFEAASYLGTNRVSPMVALQRGHPQFELHPDLKVADVDLVIDKTRYSAVLGSDIVDILRKRGVGNVIVTGVTTDVCAGNTAEDLMQRDFNVVMVWDGCAALDRLEHELYLARIFGLYGDVMPTDEVLLRLR